MTYAACSSAKGRAANRLFVALSVAIGAALAGGCLQGRQWEGRRFADEDCVGNHVCVLAPGPTSGRCQQAPSHVDVTAPIDSVLDIDTKASDALAVVTGGRPLSVTPQRRA